MYSCLTRGRHRQGVNKTEQLGKGKPRHDLYLISAGKEKNRAKASCCQLPSRNVTHPGGLSITSEYFGKPEISAWILWSLERLKKPCLCVETHMMTIRIFPGFLGAYLLAQACVSSCPQGTWPSERSRSCENCSEACAVCSGADLCKKCRMQLGLPLFLHEGRCYSKCPE